MPNVLQYLRGFFVGGQRSAEASVCVPDTAPRCEEQPRPASGTGDGPQRHDAGPPPDGNAAPEAATQTAGGDWADFKARVLADFADWLGQLDEAGMEELQREADEPERGPDLFSLLGEFTALRQDVRLHAKAGQGVREEVRAVAESVQ